MSTAYARRVHDLAQAAAARAHELAEGWEHAAPRLAINGHRADCPDRLNGPARRCRHCRADVIGREPKPVDYPAQRPAEVVHPDRPTHPAGEVRACPRCFAPTTDPEGHCR